MISDRYDEKEDIIYVDRRGSVDIKELLESIAGYDENYGHKKTLFFIDDIRGSKALFSRNDYPVIIELISQKLSKYELVCMADITDDPANTALSFLFGSIASSLENFYYSTFSTFEGAKKWLDDHR